MMNIEFKVIKSDNIRKNRFQIRRADYEKIAELAANIGKPCIAYIEGKPVGTTKQCNGTGRFTIFNARETRGDEKPEKTFYIEGTDVKIPIITDIGKYI